VSLRSMDRVMDELRMLYYELGQREFSVADDTFTLLKPRVLEFCSRMRGEFGRKFNWYCFASVDSLDAERMKAMAGAGCRSMFVGVESGSDRMLRLYKEAGDYTAAQAVAKLAEASEYFPTVLAAIIVGFPKEGLYDFLQTLRMVDVILKRGYGKVAIQSLKAIPLTPLFEQNRDKFIIPPTVGPYIGSREYGEWAKTFALMDPSLAPWAAQIPTPYPRLKELLMRHYLRRRRDLL